jgi:hypothetical protein
MMFQTHQNLGKVLPILSDEGPTNGPTNVLPEKMSRSQPVYIVKQWHNFLAYLEGMLSSKDSSAKASFSTFFFFKISSFL